MDRKSVAGFYRKFLKLNNAVLAVVGDVTKEEMRSKILASLEQWAADEPVPGPDFKKIFKEEKESVRVDRPIAQANIVMGRQWFFSVAFLFITLRKKTI